MLMFVFESATIGEVVIEADGSEVKERNADERDLRQWGVQRVTTAIETLSAAAAVCDRLESLPLQILEIEKMGGSERTIELRTGDFATLRKGVEAFVEGMPAATDSAGTGEGAGVGGSYITGWGRGQEGVVERIIGNRALLAGVYSITEGLEDMLEQQRGLATQRRRGASAPGARTAARDRVEQGVARGGDAAESQDVGVESVSVNEVPEGLLKETVPATSQLEVRVILEEEKTEEKEVVSVPKKPSVVWSPGATVMKIASAESDPIPDPPIVTTSQTSSAHISDAATSSSSSGDVRLSDINCDNIEGGGEVSKSGGNESSASLPEPAESNVEKERDREEEVQQTELFFLSIGDDFAYVGDSYTGSRNADDESRGDSRVFDTTVESSQRDTEKVLLFLAASLDVMFFLVETIVKTAGPILAGGGALAADRAAEALFSDTVSPEKFLRNKKRPRETVSSDSGGAGKQKQDTWKLLSEFRKQT
jgi:hypothetical protein